MRPIYLQLQAFGPFPKGLDLNFEELGKRSLFLISGPTGAGKTTILDAISFALYGESSGNERKAPQLRSDFALPDFPTEVKLVFEHGDRRYQIVRRPKQSLAKKRGSGLAEHQPEATVTQLKLSKTGEITGEEVLGRKVNECTEVVRGILGLDANQFRQVIMIPQGKFRQLLLAQTSEREAIFETLFDTGRYRLIQQRLKEIAKEIVEQRSKGEVQRQAILEQSESASVDELDARIAEEKTALSEFEKRKGEVAKRHAEEVRRLASIDQLGEGLRRLAELDQARKKAAVDLIASEKTLAAATKALTAEESKEKARADLRSRVVKLETLLPRVVDLEKAHNRRVKAETSSAAADQKLKDFEQKLDGADARERQSQDELDRMRTLAAQAQGRMLEFKQQSERFQLRARRDELLAKAKSLTSGAKPEALRLGKQAGEANAAAISEHERLLRERHEGRAADLASNLKPGEACPVCGSHEHPELAHTDAPVPDEKAIKAAAKNVASSADVLEKARDAFRQIQSDEKAIATQITEVESQIGSEVQSTTAKLKAELKKLEKAAAEAQQAVEKMADFEGRLEKTRQTNAKLREGQKTAAVAAQKARTEFDQATAKEEELGSQIDEELRPRGRLQEAIKMVSTELHNAEVAFKKAQQARAAAAESLAATRTHSEDLVAQQTTQLEAYSSLRAAALEVLGDSGKKHLPATDPDPKLNIDLLRSPLAQAEAETRDQLEDLQRDLGARGETVRAYQSQHKQLADLQKASADLDKRYRITGHLAEVADGKNPLRVTFQRFVLGAILDDVLQQATLRLQDMSQGRFQLYRSRETKRASGLDLEVLDHHTGEGRPVATLSGGESFLASLSLALGLADVTEAYAGGVRMETMFIDEGFGSLSSEALDLAFRTLYDLQKGGRLVGVISHVTELKERIHARLEVRSSPNGSDAEFVV